MRSLIISCVLLSTALGLVACGGGGYTAPAAIATAMPTVAPPTPTPTPPSTAPTTTLSEATLLGSAGFIAPTTNHTVYVLSGDTPATLECTVASGCTGVWPPVLPPAGVALSTGFATFTRSDNSVVQLEYMGHPLYTYSGDSAAAQTNGNGLVSFGGTWTVARP
jgi:predicted lipoprotein with Yx(FWY)xxD motif